MKLQAMFIIAAVALVGALSVVSVRAEPLDSESDKGAAQMGGSL